MKIIDRVRQLLFDIQYQFPNGITTFSLCCNGCDNAARGGGECDKCLTDQLGEIIGNDLAQRHLEAIKNYKLLHNQIIETAHLNS